MNSAAADQLPQDILESEYAIVGAGACGLSLASRLNGTTVVIETGARGIDMQLQRAHHSVVSGWRTNPDSVRVRAIGGATTRWTGRCIELDESDFEDRPWISNSTWPFRKADLQPWYEQAWDLLHVAPEADDHVLARHDKAGLYGREQSLRPCVWWYSYTGRRQYLRFAAEFRATFDLPGKQLIYAADVVAIDNDGRQVTALKLRDRSGRELTVKARHFILAAGCVNNVNLMLHTDRKAPELTAEVRDWLGRGFMQHLRAHCGDVVQTPWQFRSLQRRLNVFPRPDRGFHEVGLAIDPAHARDREIGNAAAFLQYTPRWPANPLALVQPAIGKLRGRVTIFPRGSARLVVDGEQQVSRESRITLDRSVGPNGMHRSNVDWKVSGADTRTVIEMARATCAWLKRADLGDLRLSPSLSDETIDPNAIVDSNHPLGGTRMSARPADGVVDPDGRVHGTANLWVLGGSAFATGGHGNPTLTMVALALRLAARLGEIRSA